MKPSVYIETTIPSYLTARPSRDVIRLAHQLATREWWDRRADYELYTSRLVWTECQRGDAEAARDRLATLDGIPLIAYTPQVQILADELIRLVPLPPKAASDAIHIAIAAMHGIDILLTWNCAHIANVVLQPRIAAACLAAGCVAPTLATPLQIPPARSFPMIDTDILAEIRAVREEFARAHDYDLAKMSHALMMLDRESDRPVVSRPPRTPGDANALVLEMRQAMSKNLLTGGISNEAA